MPDEASTAPINQKASKSFIGATFSYVITRQNGISLSAKQKIILVMFLHLAVLNKIQTLTPFSNSQYFHTI